MLHDPGLALTGDICRDVLIVAGQHEADLICTHLALSGAPGLRWDGRQDCAIHPRALILDCETCGGVAAAHELARALSGRGWQVPLVLLVRDLEEQVFPSDPTQDPIKLRKPLSALSARIACEFLFSKENGAQPLPVRPAVA